MTNDADKAHSKDKIDVSVGGTVLERYFTGKTEAAYVADNTLFLTADYVNLIAFETSDGLVLVDTGMVEAPKIFDEIRKKTDAPLHTVIITHGHMDHAFGLNPWLEAGEKPRIIAHENMTRRFRTYMRLAPMNIHINRVQFGMEADIHWPDKEEQFPWPDTTYREQLTIRVGGETFELYHHKGETDDSTWVWAPERGIVCTGDLYVGMLPYCGNPQKVQRYAEEWADGLEAIASVGAELLLPGHGHPIKGKDEIRKRCLITAETLRSIVKQTLEGLNAGKTHEDIMASIKIPEHLAKEPYVDPLYDKPEFIARAIIRRYGGWWNGFSSQLLPAKMADQSKEIIRLAGGIEPLVDRARELIDSDPALACHLAEWAALGAPDNRSAHECVIDVFNKRAESEIALIARGILSHAVRKSQKALATLE
ncbi:MAG: MBL fold metallo-hydrolase [Chloroflexi bacterium]|nr:MBL fold metallo-hydrolase [Chloroflexota bacterium]